MPCFGPSLPLAGTIVPWADPGIVPKFVPESFRLCRHSGRIVQPFEIPLVAALTKAGEFTQKSHATMFMIPLTLLPASYNRLVSAASTLGSAAIGMLLFAVPAHADFRVCNATQSLVGVSIGYRAPSGWVTEGWWHVDGSSCKTLIEGALSSRFYYLYAEDAERGGRWEGPINMCVAEKEFKVAGVADCFARGFQRAGFQEYDTGEQSNWMVQLTDDANGEVAGAAVPAQAAAGNVVAPVPGNP